MIKYLPKPIVSERNEQDNQLYQWLNDSHFWIQKSDTIFICQWCDKNMPMNLSDSSICKNNPVLKSLFDNENKILKTQENMAKEKASELVLKFIYAIDGFEKATPQDENAIHTGIKLALIAVQEIIKEAEKMLRHESRLHYEILNYWKLVLYEIKHWEKN